MVRYVVTGPDGREIETPHTERCTWCDNPDMDSEACCNTRDLCIDCCACCGEPADDCSALGCPAVAVRGSESARGWVTRPMPPGTPYARLCPAHVAEVIALEDADRPASTTPTPIYDRDVSRQIAERLARWIATGEWSPVIPW